MSKKEYRVIGLMSGTSLDGLDIAYCRFYHQDDSWKFDIIEAETLDYNSSLRGQLTDADSFTGNDLWQLHVSLGHHFGKLVHAFVQKHKIEVDFVCSSGHTIFHRPELGYTAQIGDGAAIAAECGFDVVCDFRSADVANGGQGAPLVPIGDKLLFSDYEFCLNIGGICNISFDHQGKRIAWDVAPANMLLNYYASSLNLLYDKDGIIASEGSVNNVLLKELNEIDYYHTPFPKSLGKEVVFEKFIPLINKFNLNVPDILATICEHVAIEIAKAGYHLDSQRLLITGGGALNKFLVERIKAHVKLQVVVPDLKIVNYKEALIFAFLGVLRFENKYNSLKEVTGAIRDSIGGAIYKG